MIPFYRYMDSYPNQRNQMPFPQYYYPSHDGIPPHVMVDQAKSPIMYESWPHGSNYAYSMPCHACGNHGNFPGYYSFRPPFPHLSPSPPHHCCGHHPSFTEQYPVHYPFPPHHWMEQPRYEYDKDIYRNFHCCGCPNLIHNQKDDKGAKIEEQEPVVEKQSDSLVPFQLKNYPHPMVWFPPEYMKKYNEHREPFESKVADQVIVPHNTKSHGNMRSPEGEPRVWNGWSPLDMNNLKSLMQGEDEKRLQHQQYEDKMKQFPFPIFWMPSKKEQDEPEKKGERKMNGWVPLDASSRKSLMQADDEKRQNQQDEDLMKQFPYPIFWIPPDNSKQGEGEKGQREANAAPISAEDSFKFIPVNPPQSDDGMIKSKTNKESSGYSQMKENNANQKSLPVKQVEERKEDNSEDSEKKVREVTTKKAENISTDNSSGTGMKRQSSSPPRMSKLPPVCLRLEPLPRKKNGNGSSRSPSPPGPKGRSQEASKDTSKPSASSSVKENASLGTQASDVSSKKIEVVEPEKCERKTIDVVDGKTSEYKNDDLRSGSQTEISVNLPVDFQEVVSKELSAETSGKDNDECKTEEDKGIRCERDVMTEGTTEAKKATGSAESADDGHRAKIKDLSDIEAATLIQSAYRAYEVRKLEPLKKLKQMARVREQLGEVRNRIQALESSDLQKNDKERVVIGEMIMSLLLKLDTIQGLHPSLRESRKTLAKELVTLQEKLDSLMMKKSKESFEDVSITKPVDDPNIDIRSDVQVQETPNEVGIVENSLEASHDNDVNIKEQDQGHLSQMESPVLNSQGQEISEQPSLAGTQVIMAETKERNYVHPEVKQSVEVPSISEEKTSSEELVDAVLQGLCCDSNGEDEDNSAKKSDGMDEPRAFSSKVIDGEPAIPELEKNELVGEEKNEICGNKLDSVMFSNVPLASTEVENMVPETDDIGADKDQETNLLTELPLGVIENDTAVSASGKHEQIETVEVKLPSGEEARFNDAANTTSSMEETSSLNEVATDTTPMDETSSFKEVEQHSLNVESDDGAQAMTEEFPGNAALKIEETEPLISAAREENSDKVLNEERDLSMIDVNAMPLLEAAVTSIAMPEFDEKKEDEQQQEPYGKEEEDVQEKKPEKQEPEFAIDDNNMEKQEPCEMKEKEVIDKKPECIKDDNKMDEPPLGSEDTKSDVLTATESSPRSIEEYDKVMDRDKKLIEENAKLREMMEKLMEAGKEQLSVISNLTGRVKDLEQKLSKKKTLRTTRHKKATPSITKLHDNAKTEEERALDVAM